MRAPCHSSGSICFFSRNSRETLLRVAAVLTDNSERAPLRGFGNQPIKIGSIVGNEPDARRVRWMILRQAHNGLYQRDCFNGRPPGAARDPAGSAVRSDDALRMQFRALSGAIDLTRESAAIRSEPKKARIEGKFSPSLLCATRQRGDQTRAFDDEIRPGKGDLCRASIRK